MSHWKCKGHTPPPSQPRAPSPEEEEALVRQGSWEAAHTPHTHGKGSPPVTQPRAKRSPAGLARPRLSVGPPPQTACQGEQRRRREGWGGVPTWTRLPGGAWKQAALRGLGAGRAAQMPERPSASGEVPAKPTAPWWERLVEPGEWAPGPQPTGHSGHAAATPDPPKRWPQAQGLLPSPMSVPKPSRHRAQAA